MLKIFRYDVTDSTNTRAREYARQADAVFPAVFIAEGQSAGRGRRGRSFDSERGAGLYISFLFRPEGRAADAVKITARAAVALARALDSVCGLSVGIKWVNDIFVGEKKLAGILTEGEINAQSGGFSYVICGIGVNLLSRSFPPEIADIVTTVEDETGKKTDVSVLSERLIKEFFRCGDADAMNEYKSRSILIGRRVTVNRLNGESFAARVIGITDGGELAVEKDGGEKELLISAEVSLKIN